jgi:hypothetical protein
VEKRTSFVLDARTVAVVKTTHFSDNSVGQRLRTLAVRSTRNNLAKAPARRPEGFVHTGADQPAAPFAMVAQARRPRLRSLDGLRSTKHGVPEFQIFSRFSCETER